MRLAWPEVLDPRRTQARKRAADGISELTILHVSDPQFGRYYLFGGNGLSPADQAHDTLCSSGCMTIWMPSPETLGYVRT